MRKLLENKLAVLWAVAITFAIVVWLISRALYWAECGWYGYQTDRETRYAAFVGCMVQLDGKWYPRNELRIAQ